MKKNKEKEEKLEMAKRGIDISEHQGDINLAALKNQIDFVIIRVGYGLTTIDKKAKRNADLCKQLGIPFGFYWYSYALNTKQAEQEAKACINFIKNYKDTYTMGIWFDMEDADGYKRRYGMPSNATLRAMCAKFCQTLENAGYYCGIYASESWFSGKLNGKEINKFDKWIAQWPTNASGAQKALNTKAESRKGLSLWQFTSDGKFNGYNGRLDVNYAYKDKYTKNAAAAPSKPSASKLKSVSEIAKEVLAGKWGNGAARMAQLSAAGYSYDEVQKKVNELSGAKPTAKKKSNKEIAKEVLAGKWGTGETRRKKLIAAGYNYQAIQDIINGKSNKIVTRTYTVKAGDTLGSIAKKYKTNWQTIYNKNKFIIGSNPNLIKAGMKLKI